MKNTAVAETEVLAPDIQQKVDQELEPYRKKDVAIAATGRPPITNDAEAMVAEVFVAQRKRDYKELEEIRDRLVRPYNSIVREINRAFKSETEVADADWRLRDQDLSTYRTEKQAAIDAANRKAIAEAEELRRQEEAKAEAARQEAERLRLEAERIEREENDRLLQAELDKLVAEQKIRDEEEAVREAKRKGDADAVAAAQKLVDDAKAAEDERLRRAEADRLSAIEAQNKIDKQVIKQESKADIAESKATMISPTIQVNDSVGQRTLADGSSVGTRSVEECYFDNGAPIYVDLAKKKYAEYCQDDPRMAGIEIPPSCWVLDMGKLIKIRKAGVLIKGMSIKKGTATTAGRK